MPIQTRPNWTQLTNRPTTVAASGLTDAATVTQATQAANPGTVAYFAANTPPAGWLACNGAAVSRTLYGALFLAIGTTYGAGDGSTTFNLPDLRGEFIRGHDGGRGVDSGRELGSAQSSQNLSHSHTGSTDSAGAHTHSTNMNFDATGAGTSSTVFSRVGTNSTAGITTSNAGAHSHTVTINANGGTEARPRNIAMLACIKF